MTLELNKPGEGNTDWATPINDNWTDIENSLPAAKGQLVSGDADGDPTRLSVGADGTVLTADSAESTGLKWATPNGVWELIATVEQSSAIASLNIVGLADSYRMYKLFGIIDSVSTADLWIRVGDPTSIKSGASDYRWARHRADQNGHNSGSSDADSVMRVIDVLHPTGSGHPACIEITAFRPNASDSVFDFEPLRLIGHSVSSVNNVTGVSRRDFSGAYRGSTSGDINVTRLQFSFSSGNINKAILRLYGLKDS